jgi:hypothetical protein
MRSERGAKNASVPTAALGVNLFLGIVFIGKIRWLLTIRVIPLGVRIPSIPIYNLAFTHMALYPKAALKGSLRVLELKAQKYTKINKST